MAQSTKFYDYIELKYDGLTNQINKWLLNVYNKSAINLNSASPYGQVLNVVKELFQHNIIYLKNAIRVLDITTTQNKKVAQYTARIAGYNIGRAISATGTLKFKLKPGIEIEKEIKDSVVIINNTTVIKNKTNSLKYNFNLNVTKNIYPVSITNNQFFVPIIQGVYESQVFTCNGRNNQMFSVNIPGNKQVENFNYVVLYNGSVLTVKDHIYDMLPAEYACVVRSGFNGGIDIETGTGNFGFIPMLGSILQVTYLLTDGAAGEILNPIDNDWKIEGEITDGQGNSINAEKLFDISVESDINFAADGDSIDFIKSALPYVSRNFVLGTPNQFIYHLKKLNMFSKVNAYNKLEDNDFTINETVIEDQIKKLNASINNNESRDMVISNLNNFNEMYAKYKTNLNDNEIYLYLIPQIKKYFNSNVNYFNIPFDVFYLDDNEKNKIMSYLRQLGTLSMTTEIIIIQPKITRYVMHIYVRRFDYASEDSIRQQIISETSSYLINNGRFDRIPKADFIRILKNVDGIDSASVYFVSEENEKYHKKGEELGYSKPQQNQKYESVSKFSYTNEREYIPNTQPLLSQPTIIKNGVQVPNQAYNPKLTIGLDSLHGDIICGKDEYAILRGGWRDRKGIWYNEDTSDPSALNSINIVFNGVTTK